MISYPRVDRSRLSHQVSDHLERLILDGQIATGSRLPPEKELSAQFGVSRNAVREALKSLEARGLVRVENGKGAFATAPTSDSVGSAIERYIQTRLDAHTIDDLYQIRQVLEGAAARACAEHATAEDLARLDAALARMEEHQDDVNRWLEADLDFHRALLAGTHNPFFAVLLDPIVKQISAAIRVGYDSAGARTGLVVHRAILDAVKARDAEAAYQAVRAVLQDSAARVKRVLPAQGTEELV